jgi:hypothetical protein
MVTHLSGVMQLILQYSELYDEPIVLYHILSPLNQLPNSLAYDRSFQS